jgi:hypothetical protein
MYLGSHVSAAWLSTATIRNTDPVCTTAQVSFDQLPRLAGKASSERQAYWRASKMLPHGALVALWSEARGGPDNPDIIFATITERRPEQLAAEDRRGAAAGTAAASPVIGIRCVMTRLVAWV